MQVVVEGSLRKWMKRACIALAAVVISIGIAVAAFPALIVQLEIISVSLGLFPAAPPFYWGAPMEARLIDVGTGSPVSGAIVVAHWQFESLSGPAGEANLQEVQSDAEGAFRFDGWGPRRRPATAWFKFRDPELLILHPSYKALVLDDRALRYRSLSFTRKSIWDGEVIGLEPRDPNDPNRYGLGLTILAMRAEPIVRAPGCQWKKIRALLAELSAEAEKLAAAGVGGLRRPRTAREWAQLAADSIDECGELNPTAPEAQR